MSARRSRRLLIAVLVAAALILAVVVGLAGRETPGEAAADGEGPMAPRAAALIARRKKAQAAQAAAHAPKPVAPPSERRLGVAAPADAAAPLPSSAEAGLESLLSPSPKELQRRARCGLVFFTYPPELFAPDASPAPGTGGRGGAATAAAKARAVAQLREETLTKVRELTGKPDMTLDEVVNLRTTYAEGDHIGALVRLARAAAGRPTNADEWGEPTVADKFWQAMQGLSARYSELLAAEGIREHEDPEQGWGEIAWGSAGLCDAIVPAGGP